VREIFLHAGGRNFAHIPCLNDSDEGMEMIETIARRELSGWI
jgi:ferrochelatase